MKQTIPKHSAAFHCDLVQPAASFYSFRFYKLLFYAPKMKKGQNTS